MYLVSLGCVASSENSGLDDLVSVSFVLETVWLLCQMDFKAKQLVLYYLKVLVSLSEGVVAGSNVML